MNRDGSTYSFLDLAALPQIGAAVLDPRPVWLWQADGGRIVWANAAGVRWFGAASDAELAGRQFSVRSPVVRKVAELAGALPAGEPTLAVLRMPKGVALASLACECQRVALPDGRPALLVAAATDDRDRTRLEAAARDLLPEIGGAGEAVAIFDGEGGLLAHSPAYLDLDGFAAAIDARLDAFLAGTERDAHTAIGGSSETARPVRLVRIASAMGELIVLVVGRVRPAVETLDDLAGWRAEPLADRPRPAAPMQPGTPPLETAPVPPAGIVAVADDDVLPAEGSRSLHPVVSRETRREEVPTPAAETVVPPPAVPVRFSWEMDGDGRFTAVSPEFAEAVGPRSATIVGRAWSEIAAEHGFDADGEVAGAIARHHSWSGLTVAWPTDDGARLPVDLAALPAYAPDRSFAGYRGFGVCRSDEAIAEEPAAPVAPAEPAPEAAAAAPDRATNIVRLRGAGDPVLRSEVLSGNERDAFRRIAEELGVPVAGDVETTAAAPAAPEAAASTATAETGLDPRLLDRLPIGIVVFREGTTLYVNRAALDMFGYGSQAEFAAAGGVEAVFPGSDSDWTGEPGEKLRARRRDRSEIAVEARLNTAPWGDSLALLLSVDRTTNAAAPSAPEPARDAGPVAVADDGRVAELEAILDTATDGVILLDGLGLILGLNRSAEALFGIEAKTTVGRPFVDLLAEESRKSALDYLDGLARNGVASLLNDGREVIGKVPSGGLIPLFMTIGRLGESGKLCAVLRDITHWKNAEEELVSARRQAEIANSQKSEFLAKISHEIRTPLNAVIGFSEVMMEERFGPIGSDRYREYLRDIHLSGTHLMSLINDLLDLSKIEAGKLDLKFEQVAVNTIIQECVALMQPEANRERIIIRTSLAAGLPDVVVDRRSLRQIVLNLLSNAIKFTQPGGQVIVSTTLEQSGEVTIRIRDTGIGMSEKQIETALMPFRQVERADRAATPGTGLGLPLTKALVEANRASFAIDSATNQGTLVRITFPATRVLAS